MSTSEKDQIYYRKKIHLDYIKEHGEFHVDCSHAIFSTEEIEILQKYGHWFRALTDGTILPFTELQKRFIAVMNHDEDPFSIEEKAWFKYLGRKKLEVEKPESFRINYMFEEDMFFTREDYYKLHSGRRNRF